MRNFRSIITKDLYLMQESGKERFARLYQDAEVRRLKLDRQKGALLEECTFKPYLTAQTPRSSARAPAAEVPVGER